MISEQPRRRSHESPKLLKRACDQCHARKVKCDGSTPCVTCRRSDSTCTFLNPVLPKGPIPKTNRARRQVEQIRTRLSKSSSPIRRSQFTVENVPSQTQLQTQPTTSIDWSAWRLQDEIFSWAQRTDPAVDTSAQNWELSTWQPGESSASVQPLQEIWQVPGASSGLDATILEGTSPTLNATLDDFSPIVTEIHHSQGQGQVQMQGQGQGQDQMHLQSERSSQGRGQGAGQAQGQRQGQGQSNGQAQVQGPAQRQGLVPTPMDDDDSFIRLLTQSIPTNNTTSITQPQVITPTFYNNFSILGTATDPTPLPSWSIPFGPPDDISPMTTLTLDSLIRPQLEIFFERIYPMIPIFPASHVYSRLLDPEQLQSPTFVSLVLSMVALSLIHPLHPSELPTRPTRARQSKVLMDEVMRLRSKWDWGCRPSVEGATTSYMMFGTLFELGHAEGARLRLKEAIGLGEGMRLGDARGYVGMERDEIGRRGRLFWVLAVTERAYALQRSGTITFHGPIHLPQLTSNPNAPRVLEDPAGQTLRHLARIFSFVDQDIIACWNGRCTPTNCTLLSRQKALDALRALTGTAGQVFGSELDLAGLSEVQKADLLITWQWIRNRIWRLAAGHGLTTSDSNPTTAILGDGGGGGGGGGDSNRRGDWELSTDYVVDVAATTVAICKRLSAGAMEAHGTGFLPVFDIG
ncbi:hypothetical protein BCR39DRAFT_174122 [Naematelia encephala]|uniref:Zn(2)-C6 fungal-type domain-containing protein n=1 Tax=Naematelia encephala TaxID=71784 RepID=A0A1Y2B3C4_9TREE|nr:hypothetical protein BCR39DRAFT_174122 [Naematelia encephala]